MNFLHKLFKKEDLEMTTDKTIPSTLNILVVDDAQINRYVLIKFLYKILTNINVEEASDGIETLEKVHNKYYDIIFLDIKMPKMGGDKVAQEIKRNNINSIIIGVTGQVEISDDVLKNGMDYCLIKPIDISKLKKFLESLLSKKYFTIL